MREILRQQSHVGILSGRVVTHVSKFLKCNNNIVGISAEIPIQVSTNGFHNHYLPAHAEKEILF